ncbi:hypothetical protein QTN25_001847 [Entamoeba marina]
MYHLFKNICCESPCNIDSKKLNITHICNGIITPLNTNCLFVNGMQIQLQVDAIKSVKEDDITTQKSHISLSERNLDLSNELVTNIKLSNCKLLQKTTFPSTLQQLTLDHCEIALYKTGSVFSIPTTVTSLSIKGNLEQQLLHLENIPLIELDLQSTSQITTKYPLTLTKLTLSISMHQKY